MSSANADTLALQRKNRKLLKKIKALKCRVDFQDKEIAGSDAVRKLIRMNAKEKISDLRRMVERQKEEMEKLICTSSKVLDQNRKVLDQNRKLERKLRAIRVQNKTRKKTVP